MRHYSMLLITLLTVILSIQANAQDTTTTTDFYENITKFNLSTIWQADSIVGEDGLDDNPPDKIKRAEPIGYIDTNFQRFQIHFISVTKAKGDPYLYHIKGKTKVKDNIHNFQGTIKIKEARILIWTDFPKYKQGYVIGDVLFYEDRKQTSTGYIKGKVTTQFIIDSVGNLRYDGLMLIADGFSNNQFECTWINYRTNKSKKCNWGDYRIPDSSNFDFGTGEFSVNPKYKHNGWDNYGYGKKEKEWWTKK